MNMQYLKCFTSDSKQKQNFSECAEEKEQERCQQGNEESPTRYQKRMDEKRPPAIFVRKRHLSRVFWYHRSY